MRSIIVPLELTVRLGREVVGLEFVIPRFLHFEVATR
jgi:hypothetical protein